jgi:hypothetical protein
MYSRASTLSEQGGECNGRARSLLTKRPDLNHHHCLTQLHTCSRCGTVSRRQWPQGCQPSHRHDACHLIASHEHFRPSSPAQWSGNHFPPLRHPSSAVRLPCLSAPLLSLLLRSKMTGQLSARCNLSSKSELLRKSGFARPSISTAE